MTQQERFNRYYAWLVLRIPIHRAYGFRGSPKLPFVVEVTVEVNNPYPNLKRWRRKINSQIQDKFYVSSTWYSAGAGKNVGRHYVCFMIRRYESKTS